MKVVLITGSTPPELCGIGDYTHRLAIALKEQGIEVNVRNIGRCPEGIVRAVESIRKDGSDIYHMQYPTVGYGQSLCPQIVFSRLRPSVVTIHEVSHVHLLRRIALYPFAFFAGKMIFTTEHEMAYATRWAPWIRKKSSVIHLGSGIGTDQNPADNTNRAGIVYFGLIRPRKGLEEVLALARELREQGSGLEIRIIGAIRPEDQAYYEQLRNAEKDLSIIWKLNLPPEEVSRELNWASMAYVPFPDGATERRSSLLALLTHGVVVISRVTPLTPNYLAKVIVEAPNGRDAAKTVIRLLDQPKKMNEIRTKSENMSKRYSWRKIAERHIEIYRKLTAGKRKL